VPTSAAERHPTCASITRTKGHRVAARHREVLLVTTVVRVLAHGAGIERHPWSLTQVAELLD
jgi:hypothetical protein